MADKQELRNNILAKLYAIYFEKPFAHLSRAELITKLGISEAELDTNIVYLEEKNLVTLFKALGSIFVSAKLTAQGVDYVERQKLV